MTSWVVSEPTPTRPLYWGGSALAVGACEMSEVAPTPTTATAAAMRPSFRLKDIVGMFVSAPLLDGAQRVGAGDAAF